MSKQLLLLRHAKSDWEAGSRDDLSRPLNKRGIRDAQLIGHWISQHNLLPDLILCSSASRARETMEHVLSHFDDENITTEFSRILYQADLNDLLKTIQNISGSTQRPMIIGHNPEMEELTGYLSIDPIPLADKNKLLTTANLVVLDVPGDFCEITRQGLKLVSLTRPKELRSQF